MYSLISLKKFCRYDKMIKIVDNFWWFWKGIWQISFDETYIKIPSKVINTMTFKYIYQIAPKDISPKACKDVNYQILLGIWYLADIICYQISFRYIFRDLCYKKCLLNKIMKKRKKIIKYIIMIHTKIKPLNIFQIFRPTINTLNGYILSVFKIIQTPAKYASKQINHKYIH